MGWHAVEAVDDAVETTRRFLFPFSVVRWAKLAFLVFLMGGSANAGVSGPAAPDALIGGISGSYGSWVAGTEPGVAAFENAVSNFLAEMPSDWLIAAVGVVAVLGLVAFSVVSLSLRLVFYHALRTNEVRLWRPFLGRLRQATGLFVASAALWSLAAGPIAVAVLGAAAAETPIGRGPLDSFAATVGSLSIGPAVAAGLLGSAVVLLATLALRLTYEFVAPTMVFEETGVLAGWRRVWRAVSGEWADLVVYLAVHFFVAVGIAVVEGIALVIAGSAVVVVAGSALLIAAVPLGGLGALTSTAVGIATVAIVAAVAVATLVVLTLPVSVVTRSYLIAYEVATIGGIDPDLRLLHPDIDPDSTGDAPASAGADRPPTDRD
ncbi:hypothetical protein C471_01484 [Halorubrum saccharovorum DSM 1137]|uniref:Uncharacterized protein n=1 Tax=Halorubrum saccharovorum DSM 1137 TaxID=1227484 RepID=M0E7W2_9EURY|nr:hypothetical protein [Halorubrum saccharovorum]ELZ43088.1 hypothetical protein C471_01484 [Halorubrum saccharovorum DSM 1137]